MMCGNAERRLQCLIGRLVAHNMKKRDNRVKGATEVRCTDISDFAGEGAGGFGERTATSRSREGNHIGAAFNAMDVQAHCSEQVTVAAGSRAEFQNGARMRYWTANLLRNVIGLRSVILVAVKQVVEGRILLKIGHGPVGRKLASPKL